MLHTHTYIDPHTKKNTQELLVRRCSRTCVCVCERERERERERFVYLCVCIVGGINYIFFLKKV
jgi:hypothetical protein